MFSGSLDAQRPCAVPVESALTDLLARMARVASLYRDTALKFECTEEIEYESREGDGPRNAYVKFSYLYERDAAGKFSNCRLWRDSVTNGKNFRCVDPSEYKIRMSLNNAYLWIFAFLKDRQPWHEYRIAGEETVLGRRAVVVDYAPKNAIRAGVNDWHGRAWIDAESHQLLRVRAYRPESWAGLQGLEKVRTSTDRANPPREEFEVETVFTEFNEQKNGMRFASLVRLERSRYSWKNDYKETKLIEVVQSYRKYRFYHVATHEQIEGIVNGAEGPAAASGP